MNNAKGGWIILGKKSLRSAFLTYYGTDNPIDGVILDVLIRKHKSIKSDLGVTVKCRVPASRSLRRYLRGRCSVRRQNPMQYS